MQAIYVTITTFSGTIAAGSLIVAIIQACDVLPCSMCCHDRGHDHAWEACDVFP